MTPRQTYAPSEVFRRLRRNLRQADHLYMVLIALGIGLLGGLAAVGFRKLIEVGNQIAWGEGQYTLDYIRSLPWWWKVVVPSAGGFIVGTIVYYFAPEAKGHGVPEVMEAVALRQGRIRPRVVAAKLLASGICIASGGSVGREGPIVQIGATLGSTIGQWLKIDPRRLRTLVGCGAAAGIAGTFNAPIAGAMFAVEIVLADFAVGQFSPIVISSVAATVVSRHFLGDFPAFAVPAYSLEHAGELVAYVVLGLLAGLAALAFIKILYGCEDLFEKIRVYPPIKTAAGGALIGLIALKLPEIYGVGYEAINGALRDEMVWYFMLLLVAAKIVAVSITIGSGGSGGIFAPSLFIGAMLGGAVGTVVHSIWPASTASAGAYALVGMGAIVAAGTHAPITAILIIFELTSDYKIILPLMITCIIATLVSTGLQRSSIYTLKLLRRGVDIRQGPQLDVLKHVKVREVMRPEFIAAGPGEGLIAILARFRAGSHTSIFVVEGGDVLLGIVTIYDIRPIIDEAPMVGSLLVASDLMAKRNFPRVSPDDTLDNVMKNIGRYRGEMPVVEDGRLVGAIWPEDVIKRYNTEVFKRDMASSVLMSVGDGIGPAPVPGAEGLSLATIAVPGELVGKTLSQSEVRGRHGITVVLITQKVDGVEKLMNAVPGPDYVFRDGDQMLVIGPEEAINRLHQMV